MQIITERGGEVQEAAQSNKADEVVAAIKTAHKVVSDLCNTWEISVHAFKDDPVYIVLVVSVRDLDQIPAPLEAFPGKDITRQWKYRKIYKGVEFYCFDIGGEER